MDANLRTKTGEAWEISILHTSYMVAVYKHIFYHINISDTLTNYLNANDAKEVYTCTHTQGSHDST